MDRGLRPTLIAMAAIALIAGVLTHYGEDSLLTALGSRTPGEARAAVTREAKMDTHRATFGAGCFWGVEEAFRQVEGVTATAVGYAGGDYQNPAYRDVCTGTTGHAEVVQVEYDPEQVSYAELLEVFWRCHDPTTLNRQGPDIGTQYRSVIFFHSPEQEAAAKASKEQLDRSGRFHRGIVTQITAATPFYRAEEYHQKYLEKRGQSSCGVSPQP